MSDINDVLSPADGADTNSAMPGDASAVEAKKQLEEAVKKSEADAAKKAEEAAKKEAAKKEAEAKKKAEVEAKKKAEADAKKKAEADAAAKHAASQDKLQDGEPSSVSCTTPPRIYFTRPVRVYGRPNFSAPVLTKYAGVMTLVRRVGGGFVEVRARLGGARPGTYYIEANSVSREVYDALPD